jgi:hypothetical protein
MDDDNVLFRSPDLIVRRGQRFGGAVCVVTFSPFTHERTLDRPGFGEAFLASRQTDAVHVISRTNAWFDHPQIAEALAAVAEGVRGYGRVVTYGSSMGGYGALRFAEAVGAQAAVALSPQYGLPPAAPFEDRFRSERVGRAGLDPRHFSQTVTPFVFYDPRDLDQRHVHLIRGAYPRTIALPMPHAGHPVGPYMDEAGLLTGAILDIAADRFQPEPFIAAARARRRQSSQYLFTLARRLGPGHLKTKRALTLLAIAQRDDATYRLYLATLLEMDGDLAGAEAELNRAAVILPGHAVVLYAQASFLMRGRRNAEARPLVADLVAGDPRNHRFAEMLTVIDAAGPWRLPAAPAALTPRFAWTVWLAALGLLARLHATPLGRVLPRWHDRFTNLPRQLQMIDEWRTRRRRKAA